MFSDQLLPLQVALHGLSGWLFFPISNPADMFILVIYLPADYIASRRNFRVAGW